LIKIEPQICFNILYKLKFILFPIFIIIFGILVILGYIIHNKNENKYKRVLEIFCSFTKDQIFGINTAYHSALILIIIAGYIGILFLRYNMNKNYLIKENMFYNWNKGPRLKTLKIAVFLLSYLQFL
jgi:hypothetical protein